MTGIKRYVESISIQSDMIDIKRTSSIDTITSTAPGTTRIMRVGATCASTTKNLSNFKYNNLTIQCITYGAGMHESVSLINKIQIIDGNN